MAHYCTNPRKVKNCEHVYRGLKIGTNKELCNVFSEHKPCEETIKKDTIFSKIKLFFKNGWTKK